MTKNSLIEFCGWAGDAPWSKAASETHVLMQPHFRESDFAVLESLNLGDRLGLICDPNTYDAYGSHVEKALGHRARHIALPHNASPDMATVTQLRTATSECTALVGVGGGTISDLCKYTSFLDKKPYAICATALSMNGYASANASISEHGHKKSLTAHLPRAILLDLGMLAKSPQRLLRSGLGDSLCRSTAQADWLLSHLLLGTPYDDTPFRLLAHYESALFQNVEGLLRGDLAVIELLARTLIASGLGMVMAGGSYPASQGEHLIAHTMEMKHGASLPETYHGEQIGVTTLTMARLQDAALSQRPRFHATRIDEQAIRNYFGNETGNEVIAAYRKKAISAQHAEALNDLMSREWADIAERIQAVRLPTSLLEETLKKAGCPSMPEELGWPRAEYEEAVHFAHTIRERFTFLDTGL